MVNYNIKKELALEQIIEWANQFKNITALQNCKTLAEKGNLKNSIYAMILAVKNELKEYKNTNNFERYLNAKTIMLVINTVKKTLTLH